MTNHQEHGITRRGTPRNTAKALLVAGAIGALALAGLSGAMAKHGDDDWEEGIFASGGSGGSGIWDDDFASGDSGGSGIWMMPGSGGSGGSGGSSGSGIWMMPGSGGSGGWDDDLFDDDWFDD